MKNKKYLVIGLAAVLALAAVLVGVLVFGRGEEPQPTDPTNNVTEATPGNQTDGTEATGDPTDGIEATGDPTDGIEATGEATDPAETEPDVTGPAETEPGKVDPTETEPAATDPAATDPAVTDPSETEPDVTEPAPTDPAETKPAETGPKETEPKETEPEATEHVHNYEHVKEEKKPTCTEPGYTDIACECGHFRTVGYEALGHDWSEWVITVEPTTTSTGERQRTCSHCGTVTEVVPALDPETGEVYESYIDPRIVLKTKGTITMYRYGSVSALDYRKWGDPPSIWVNDDGSLTVVYFQQDGTRIEVLVEVPSPEYNHCCVIMEDGSYALKLTGSYGG